ncbi:ArsR family transcriptional regulator [Halostreptopolyspora alba]|uniref:ArsR family transcriptional regulator n=2 Tax=Halostreptopolyspora alba TaxID=2487137 RepID=A0A3N0EED3_9ACTN|nr:ArsR family transcriptional regulator [Nocardiopsaceae bacterium YIM 96095]
MDAVFKALADSNRRRLLDSLNARDGQSLRELCGELEMSRQAVSKHLATLEAVNLVTTVRRGRQKLHYLNPIPINDIAERWIGRYHGRRVGMLAELKDTLEEAMTKPEFVYTTYIATTPQRLWRALTEPAFIRQWFEETGPESDWQVGSPVKWSSAPGQPPLDLDQVVLESDPPRRLSYTWHTYQPEHQEMFGWSDEHLAELRNEPRSIVTFDIEPTGDTVKLTVTHHGFEAETEMLRAVSQGWPILLSNLKSLLETGRTLQLHETGKAGS